MQNPCCCDTPAPHLRCRAYDATTVGVTNPTYNCTKAWGSRSYNLYTGNSSYLARKDSTFYSSMPASDVKFGWCVGQTKQDGLACRKLILHGACMHDPASHCAAGTPMVVQPASSTSARSQRRCTHALQRRLRPQQSRLGLVSIRMLWKQTGCLLHVKRGGSMLRSTNRSVGPGKPTASMQARKPGRRGDEAA